MEINMFITIIKVAKLFIEDCIQRYNLEELDVNRLNVLISMCDLSQYEILRVDLYSKLLFNNPRFRTDILLYIRIHIEDKSYHLVWPSSVQEFEIIKHKYCGEGGLHQLKEFIDVIIKYPTRHLR